MRWYAAEIHCMPAMHPAPVNLASSSPWLLMLQRCLSLLCKMKQQSWQQQGLAGRRLHCHTLDFYCLSLPACRCNSLFRLCKTIVRVCHIGARVLLQHET